MSGSVRFAFGFADKLIQVEAPSGGEAGPTLGEWKRALLQTPELVDAGVSSVFRISIVDQTAGGSGEALVDDDAVLDFALPADAAAGIKRGEDGAEKTADRVEPAKFRVVLMQDPLVQLRDHWTSVTGATCEPGLSDKEIEAMLPRLVGEYPLEHIRVPEPIQRLFLCAGEWRWRRYLFRLGGCDADSEFHEEYSENAGWLVFGDFNDMGRGLDHRYSFNTEAGALWIVDCRSDKPTHGCVMYMHEKDEPHFVCSSASVFVANFEVFVGTTMERIKSVLEAAKEAGDDKDDEGAEDEVLMSSNPARNSTNPARNFFSRGDPRILDQAWLRQHSADLLSV